MIIEREMARISGLEAEIETINQNIDDLCEELEDADSDVIYNRLSMRITKRVKQRISLQKEWRKAQAALDSEFRILKL